MFEYELQSAVYDRLTQSAAITDQIGNAVFDSLPAKKLPPIYIQIGEGDTKDLSGLDTPLFQHRLIVDLVALGDAFTSTKALAPNVALALQAPLELTSGQLVSQTLSASQARRINQGHDRRLRYILSCLVSKDLAIDPVSEPTE